jgi:hypothetical protein
MIRYSGIASFTKYTSRGEPFTVYRELPLVPRIDNQFLDCSIYLYHSEEEASRGERSGGSGFIVGVPGFGDGWLIPGATCPRPGVIYHAYAVTNRHVVKKRNTSEPSSPVIRLNQDSGKTDILPLTVDDWFTAEELISEDHDIAVVPINHQDYYAYRFIPTDAFLTKEISTRYDVGIGDVVFMVGRFVGHDGRQRNEPSTRWGHVSSMPVEHVHHPSNRNGKQESFLVEMHSISGYSGSPVIVRPFPESILRVDYYGSPTNTHMMMPTRDDPIQTGGPWLLGVDWGYINNHEQRDNNTGISGVVPAWHLLKLLNSDKLREQRRKQQKEELDRAITREC